MKGNNLKINQKIQNKNISCIILAVKNITLLHWYIANQLKSLAKKNKIRIIIATTYDPEKSYIKEDPKLFTYKLRNLFNEINIKLKNVEFIVDKEQGIVINNSYDIAQLIIDYNSAFKKFNTSHYKYFITSLAQEKTDYLVIPDFRDEDLSTIEKIYKLVNKSVPKILIIKSVKNLIGTYDLTDPELNLCFEDSPLKLKNKIRKIKNKKLLSEYFKLFDCNNIEGLIERVINIKSKIYKQRKIIENKMNITLSQNKIFSLSSKTRIQMLKLIIRGKTRASELAEAIKISLPTTLKHLKILEKGGLIYRTKHKIDTGRSEYFSFAREYNFKLKL